MAARAVFLRRVRLDIGPVSPGGGPAISTRPSELMAVEIDASRARSGTGPPTRVPDGPAPVAARGGATEGAKLTSAVLVSLAAAGLAYGERPACRAARFVDAGRTAPPTTPVLSIVAAITRALARAAPLRGTGSAGSPHSFGGTLTVIDTLRTSPPRPLRRRTMDGARCRVRCPCRLSNRHRSRNCWVYSKRRRRACGGEYRRVRLRGVRVGAPFAAVAAFIQHVTSLKLCLPYYYPLARLGPN